MLRITVPGIVDVVLVDQPRHMRWLNDHPAVTRAVGPAGGLLHKLLNQRMTRDLRFPEGLLPVFLPREDQARAQRQKELEQRFNRNAGVPSAPTDTLVAYVAGCASESQMEVAAQAFCGQLFGRDYAATARSYRAGERIARFPSLDPLRALGLKLSGGLSSAKRTLASAARQDPYCVHGTSIGMLNVVHSMRAMKGLAADPRSAAWSTRGAVLRSLSAPPAAVRACRERIDAPFLRAPLTQRTLIVFLLRRMYERDLDSDLAFMGGSWNACPARRAVIDLLANVWDAAATRGEPLRERARSERAPAPAPARAAAREHGSEEPLTRHA